MSNNIILQNFNIAKATFEKARVEEDGAKVMQKITELVNYLGVNFLTLNGGELAEIQIKLAGYMFHLSDYVAELNRISEALKMEMKEFRAKRWDEITELIKSEKGKVSNKEQVENVLILEMRDVANEQILYETQYYKYKLKMSSVNDILTACVQQIAQRKREVEQIKLGQ